MNSPRGKARIAGASYVLAVVTALCGEAIGRGKLAIALGFVQSPASLSSLSSSTPFSSL